MFKSTSYFINLLKCLLISLIITILSILVFSILLKVFSLDNVVIKPVNYLIKTLSIFVATLLSVKENKGAVKGLSFGAISTIVCYLFVSVFIMASKKRYFVLGT